uniref:Uncharacterized protein n=1 Tax=Aegilops tauschii subsp. strangulata TaxID=200361 RepID=A0A453M956_AEGTS
MGRYLQILELEEPMARMKVIHVAGTKGHPCRAARSGSSDSSAHQSGTPSPLRPDSPLASVRRCPRSKVAQGRTRALARGSFRTLVPILCGVEIPLPVCRSRAPRLVAWYF